MKLLSDSGVIYDVDNLIEVSEWKSVSSFSIDDKQFMKYELFDGTSIVKCIEN